MTSHKPIEININNLSESARNALCAEFGICQYQFLRRQEGKKRRVNQWVAVVTSWAPEGTADKVRAAVAAAS
jgi:hypothetical protein